MVHTVRLGVHLKLLHIDHYNNETKIPLQKWAAHTMYM